MRNSLHNFIMREAAVCSRMKPKNALTRARRRKLESLTDDWRQEEYDWKAGRVFLDLEERGLCEMRDRSIRACDVRTGPGNTSVMRWFTRRTPAGKAALSAGQRTTEGGA